MPETDAQRITVSSLYQWPPPWKFNNISSLGLALLESNMDSEYEYSVLYYLVVIRGNSWDSVWTLKSYGKLPVMCV